MVQRITINIEEYRDQIGPAYHYKYRRIQELDRRSAQHSIINIEESRSQIGTAYHHKYRRIPEPDRRSQIGTAYHHKYRRIQKPDRHNVPHPIPKHTDKSQQRSTHNNEELLPCPRGWGCRGRAFGLRNSEMAFPLHIPALKMRPA